MVTESAYNGAAAWQCDACKLHYETEDLATACEEYCRSEAGCSEEITRQSLERQQTRET